MVIILFPLFLIFLSYLKLKNLHNPLFVFSLWFFISTLILFIDPFDYTYPINSINLSVMGYLSFTISFLFFNNKRKASITRVFKPYKFLKFLIFFTLFLSLFVYIELLASFLEGVSLSYIRDLYFAEPITFLEKILYYIDRFLVIPLRYISLISFGFLLANKKVSFLDFLFFSSMVLISILSTGGRFILVNLFYAIVFSLLISSKKTTRKKFIGSVKNYISVVGLTAIVLVLGFYITSLRVSIGNLNLLSSYIKTIYLYFFGGFHFFETIIATYNIIPINIFGFSLLRGFLEPIISILSFLTNFNSPEFFSSVLYYTEPSLDIGNFTFYNAFSTAYFYGYVDSGLFGIVFIFFIIGILSKYFYNNISSSNNFYFYSVYILNLIMISNFNTTLFLYSSTFSLSYLYIIIFYSLFLFSQKFSKVKK